MNATYGLFLSIALLLPAPPRPNTVPRSWNLRFDYDDIQRITVDLPNGGPKTTYWYLIYTVTNDSGQEVAFYPAFEVLTNHGRRIKSQLGVRPAAFVAIKNRHARSHPITPCVIRSVNKPGPSTVATVLASQPMPDSMTLMTGSAHEKID